MSLRFEAGFGQGDITPKVGLGIPGAILRNRSEKIHDPLWVTAMLLNDGTNPLVIVGVDALMVSSSLVSQAREEIYTRLGIPRESVMVIASHTHEGGPTADILLCKSDHEY